MDKAKPSMTHSDPTEWMRDRIEQLEAERSARCPHCGREVRWVPGGHTLPGGPPSCPQSHVPEIRLDELERELDEARAKARSLLAYLTDTQRLWEIGNVPWLEEEE